MLILGLYEVFIGTYVTYVPEAIVEDLKLSLLHMLHTLIRTWSHYTFV